MVIALRLENVIGRVGIDQSLNFAYAFKCYQQNSKLASL